MHSEWSDGSPTVQEIADACVERGYQYAAVTDHSYGLKIAGGMSMAEAAAQRLAIDDVNARYDGRFRLLQGIEANIDAAGQLDLTDDEAATFDVVLAAPHSRLRKNDDQTDRMLTAVQHPAVRILAHPRGRITGSRAGVIANWDAVFEAAAQRGVAIEIDGDPARQDLDYTLAGVRSRPAVSLRSTATRTPRRSCPTPRPPWRMRGLPAFPPTESSTAGRSSGCWPGCRILDPPSPAVRSALGRLDIRIGTAGWSIPRAAAPRFDSDGTHLQRYSRRFRCAEINSSFHRPHAAATYAKWRDSTPADFRFAVKMPRTITHELKLQDAREPFVTFLAQTDGLAEKRGPILVQLPPSLSFDASVVTRISGRGANGLRRARGVRAEACDLVLAGCGFAAGSLRNLTSGGRSAAGAGSNRSRGLAARRIFSAARITAEVLVTI